MSTVSANTSEHSILAPSAASSWLNCHAMPLMCKGIPAETSPNAEEGTLAHTLAAQCLIHGHMPDQYKTVTQDGKQIAIPEDMHVPVGEYVETVRAMTEGYSERSVECTLDTSGILLVPNQKGTGDVVAIVFEDDAYILHIHDLKYGKGIKVYAEENVQLLIYACAAYESLSLLYDIAGIKLVIHQPRLGVVSEWECTVGYMLEFRERARIAAANCMSLYEGRRKLEEDDFAPSEKACRWCLAKGTCDALAEKVMGSVKGDFKNIEDPVNALPGMDNAALAERLRDVDLIKMYAAAVETAGLRRALNGEVVPGFKIVLGRAGNRQWSDSSEIIESVLKSMRLKQDDYYSKKIKSPKQVLDRIAKKHPGKAKRLQEYIVRKDPVKHLVPVSDDREAVVVGKIADDFEII